MRLTFQKAMLSIKNHVFIDNGINKLHVVIEKLFPDYRKLITP